MPATRGELEHLLRQLGYQRDNRDHRFFRLEVNGKPVAVTKTSHGPRTIDDSLLAEVARQMRIRPAFLRALLAGKKGRADYEAELRRQGLLPQEDDG